jgi:hypothetical protein
VTVKVDFDDLDLTLELSYQGSLPALSPPESLLGAPDAHFFQDMAGAWQCWCPDPVVCAAQGAHCRIRLVF